MRLSMVDLGAVAPGTAEKQPLIDSLRFTEPADRCRSHQLPAGAFDLTPTTATPR